ncbi:hypothetical protein, partial [Plasmodium yoelii yoelii]
MHNTICFFVDKTFYLVKLIICIIFVLISIILRQLNCSNRIIYE